jgi:hypothetical protein
MSQAKGPADEAAPRILQSIEKKELIRLIAKYGLPS